MPYPSHLHEFYMQTALTQAQKAFNHNEVPIGAIVVNPEGVIIARSYNQVESKRLQTCHAEIQAITKACKKLKDWRLNGYWIYVTLEPCAMCMNLILLSRFEGLVYGASSPIFGYELDTKGPLQLYRRNTLQIYKGVHADASAQLLKDFFKKKRNTQSE